MSWWVTGSIGIRIEVALLNLWVLSPHFSLTLSLECMPGAGLG